MELFLNKNIVEVGCDEAGRGCLAGPVFAAAVVLPNRFDLRIINDSKKMNKKQRDEMREYIENNSLNWAVASVNNQEIDNINILQASILAMHRALQLLKCTFEHIIVDGNKFKNYNNIPHTCIIKGDGKYASIAAASILAKTHRDEYMNSIHNEYQVYKWNKNMGYPTNEHRNAIVENGICKYHRKSFKLLPDNTLFDCL